MLSSVASKDQKFTKAQATIQLATARLIVSPFYFLYKRLSIAGKENLPDHGPFLVVSNHLSYFDPPILVVATMQPTGFVAKTELFQVPFLKELIDLYGAVPINRDKPSLSSIRAVKNIFQHGWCVAIFIEGTRNKTPGVLGTPHTGPAYFAWSNHVPILPIGLINTNTKWGNASAKIGQIIQPSADLESTTWEIMNSLSKLTGFALPNKHP